MSETRYVQHKSGQGETFKVSDELTSCWHIWEPPPAPCNFYLPKSEYLLCDPPETWEDVTADCDVEAHFIQHDGEKVTTTVGQITRKGYRLRKIYLVPDGWCFIVEKRQ